MVTVTKFSTFNELKSAELATLSPKERKKRHVRFKLFIQELMKKHASESSLKRAS